MQTAALTLLLLLWFNGEHEGSFRTIAAHFFPVLVGIIVRHRFLFSSLLGLYGFMLIWREFTAQLPIPSEWDFGCYYLYGLAAKSGFNFYEPLLIEGHPLANSFSTDFYSEIVRVGFPYPPPSMFVFLALALLPYTTAYVTWSAVNLLALLAAVSWLLRSADFHGSIPPVLAVGLFLLWPSVSVNFHYAQSNLLVLAALTSAFYWREHWPSGISLAMGAIVKPWVMLVLGFSVLSRNYWAVLAAMFSLAFAFMAAALLFGAETMHSYGSLDFLSRFPKDIWLDSMNESLLSTVIRITHFPLQSGSPFRSSVFLAISAGIILVTLGAFSCSGKGRSSPERFVLILTAALLLYPHTLEHYSVVLLIPVLLYTKKYFLSGDLRWAVLIAFLSSICEFQSGSHTFVANFVTWAVTASTIFQSRTSSRSKDPLQRT